jgi:uncharacterized membrane protein
MGANTGRIGWRSSTDVGDATATSGRPCSEDLHTEADLIDAYDAAVIERREDGKVKIVKKHETPTRVGGVLGGGMGLATGLVVALFPAAAIGGGLLAATRAVEKKQLQADADEIEKDAQDS